MQIRQVRVKETAAYSAVPYFLLLVSGLVIMAFAMPVAIRLFFADPVGDIAVFGGAVCWIISIRLLRRYSR
jgi:hypothetical protein